MNIHNKLVIKTKEKSFVFFNQMQNYIYKMIAECKRYNNSFAFGSGSGVSLPEEEKLKNVTFVKNSEISGFNYDAYSKKFFVSKKVVFDEDDPNEYSFCEVGVSPNEEGDLLEDVTVVNRFRLVDESGNETIVYRRPFEYMEVEVFIYLQESDGSSINFVGKDNDFVKLLLGVYEGDEPLFSVAKGYNVVSSADRVIVDPKTFVLCNSVSFKIYEKTNSSGVVIELLAEFEEGNVFEFLVLLNGKPCLRVRKFAENPIVASFYDLEASPNELGCLVFKDLVKTGNVYLTNSESGESESFYETEFKSESLIPDTIDLYKNNDDFNPDKIINKNSSFYFMISDLPTDFQIYYNFNNDIMQVDTSAVDRKNIKKIAISNSLLAVYYEDDLNESGCKLKLFYLGSDGVGLINELTAENEEILTLLSSKIDKFDLACEAGLNSTKINLSTEYAIYSFLVEVDVPNMSANIKNLVYRNLLANEVVLRIESTSGGSLFGDAVAVFVTNQNRIYILNNEFGIFDDWPENSDINLIVRESVFLGGDGIRFLLAKKNEKNLYDLLIYDCVLGEVIKSVPVDAKKVYFCPIFSVLFVEEENGCASLWIYNKFDCTVSRFRNEINFDFIKYPPHKAVVLANGLLVMFSSRNLKPVYIPFASGHLAISGLDPNKKYNVNSMSCGCIYYNKKNIRAKIELLIS